MRRLPALALVLVVCVSSCDRADEPDPTTPAVTTVSTPPPSAPIPSGVPSSFDADVSADDLPANELVPPHTEVTDRLVASTSAGDAVVLMFADRGGDPFRRAQGFVVWRRTEGEAPAWRPVFGLTHPGADGVIAIQGITGDATGDGSDDALVFEATGGVGTCGRWRVIDLAAGTQRWHRDLCDTQVDISTQPPGLTLTETVYEPGDSHCCPSAIRTSIWEFDPADGFVETSQDTSPL